MWNPMSYLRAIRNAVTQFLAVPQPYVSQADCEAEVERKAAKKAG